MERGYLLIISILHKTNSQKVDILYRQEYRPFFINRTPPIKTRPETVSCQPGRHLHALLLNMIYSLANFSLNNKCN